MGVPDSRRRDDRLELRLSAESKKLLLQAAELRNQSISAFVLDSGLTAAEQALADRVQFKLSAKAYDAFVSALDQSPKSKPRLDALLNSPSVLE